MQQHNNKPTAETGEAWDARQRDGPTHEPEPAHRPRIYVASLSDYNAGRLHGVWIDATQSVDGVQGAIDAMLAASPEPHAEEWAIHDHDGFGAWSVGEYESLEAVVAVADRIAEHGPAFAAWASLVDQRDDAETLGLFEDAYRGHWADVVEYADELLTDIGATDALNEIPEWLQPYVTIDVAAFARDLQLGGDIAVVEGEGGVYVFDATF